MLHELGREGADALAPEGQVDDREGPPGEVEAHWASDSSMGTRAAPKRVMPARSPSASAMAAPSVRATSSTVWCSSTSRSPAAVISMSMSE